MRHGQEGDERARGEHRQDVEAASSQRASDVTPSPQPSPPGGRGSQTYRLWDCAAPLAVGDQPEDIPTITHFEPDKPDGSAIVVCPGGGYQNLADHEGEPVARWLTSHGITAFVLKYRLAPRYQHPAMWYDLSRAIRTLRARAGEWNLDPTRVGVLGFSAGGHLASTVATHFDQDERPLDDPINRQSARPDVAILLYAVITLHEPSVHTGSRKNLFGPAPTPAQIDLMSNDQHVTPRTPPTFLFHTVEDQAVPIENSLRFAAAMRRAGVPFELHAYEPGHHGVGLASQHPVLNTWTTCCINWLRIRGFGVEK
jgi:acetyl esterase/lipase